MSRIGLPLQNMTNQMEAAGKRRKFRHQRANAAAIVR
jgi:hypothetical protein